MRLLPRRLDYGEEATLVEHLGELRGRLVVCLIALAAGFSVGYAFHSWIIDKLIEALPPERQEQGIVTLDVTEPFFTSIQIALYAGFLIAMPVIIWQIWEFFGPAFGHGTRRMVVLMALFATALGVCGFFFSYLVALPAALHFLTSYDDDVFNIQIRAKSFLSFASLVILATTVVFEVPIVILGLVKLRVLSYAKLARNRRIGYVAMVALAVALPGVDPITTFFEMVPLLILFEGSIWMALLMERRSRKAAAERDLAHEV